MKKLLFVGCVVLGLGTVAFANKAMVELEHANKTANDVESVGGDMSAMKAAGKCNADQNAKTKVPKVQVKKAKTKSELALEHASKLATGDDSVQENMGDMKAQGKCNSK